MIQTINPDWATVVLEQQDRVYRLALHLTGSRADAEDLTVAVFGQLVRHLPTYATGDRPGIRSGDVDVWVATTYQLWQDRRRQRRRVAVPPLGAEPADHLGVRAALARLPECYRVPVVLCDVGGLAYDDIAALLGVPPGTVELRIRQGRGLLRAALAHRVDRAPQVSSVAVPAVPARTRRPPGAPAHSTRPGPGRPPWPWPSPA